MRFPRSQIRDRRNKPVPPRVPFCRRRANGRTAHGFEGFSQGVCRCGFRDAGSFGSAVAPAAAMRWTSARGRQATAARSALVDRSIRSVCLPLRPNHRPGRCCCWASRDWALPAASGGSVEDSRFRATMKSGPTTRRGARKRLLTEGVDILLLKIRIYGITIPLIKISIPPSVQFGCPMRPMRRTKDSNRVGRKRHRNPLESHETRKEMVGVFCALQLEIEPASEEIYFSPQADELARNCRAPRAFGGSIGPRRLTRRLMR